ncbi:protein angel homolog 1 [Mastacembelus armatus]|uniref:Angel homolog 1 (Drosophila) n=1 Tax=Mastacembelus armatus TaxID=205130 RepID=A0A3Q3RT63_9TELE|nr:protein angel homolog 1 [Mastacembelus armatus]
MIGSLLFYVLYPFSRFWTIRPSEASKKGLPPVVVNGTAAWDGGAVTSKRITQCQKTLLDQWHTPGSRTKGETKERMKKSGPEKENDHTTADMDKKQLMAAAHEGTKNEAAPKICDGQPAVEEKETAMTNGQQQDSVDTPKHEDGGMIVHHEVLHENNNTEDGNIFPTDDISPEQACRAQTTEDSKHQTVCCVQEQKQIQNMEETVTVCWDEYAAPTADEIHGGASGSNLVFTSLLSNSQTTNVSSQHNTQTGWQFPIGPGLAEEVHCPMWTFPAVSYYPPFEFTLPFKVMWRVWQEIDESATEEEPAFTPFPFTKVSMDFTVMSYNILAQDLLEANQELYAHCPLEVLDWSYRYFLLLEEIQKWAPDILCLQEVQENHYHEHLYPVLSQMGYTCVYKRRTGTKTDGCATCYRGDYFSVVSLSQLEFFRPETELLDRHNVGIVLLLQPVATQGVKVTAKGPPLCVANTHLLFNPRRGDVKLAQLAIMLAEIDSMVQSCATKGEHCNVILCGDFNSVPHMPLYQLITTGKLYYHGLPAWMISGQEDLSFKSHCHRLFAPLWPSTLGITDNCQYAASEDMCQSQNQESGKCQYTHAFMLQLRYCPAACVRPQGLMLIPGVTDNTPDPTSRNQPYNKRFSNPISHPLDLESVYKHIPPVSGVSEVTTLNSEVGATVDYIFYSPRRILSSAQKADGDFVSKGLKLTGSVSLLSEDVLWSMKGLPNHIFPSDHLSLIAKFQLDWNAA